MSALPGLSPTEEAFFKSGGTDEAAVTKLREETNIPVMLPKTSAEETAETTSVETTQPAKTEPEIKPEEVAKASVESEKARQKLLADLGAVPLAALQEARAEAKALKQQQAEFNAWKQQIEPILAQLPKAEQEQAPDPNTDPFGYQNWALGKLGTTVQDMQRWRQEQEQQAQAQAQTQRVLNWASQQAQAFQKATPDFPDAYNFAKEGRTKELLALGYDPTAIDSALEQEQAQIIYYAAQNGKNPAELVYNYAKARGFQGKQPATSALDPNAAAKIAAGQAQAAKMNQGGQTAEGEMTPKDLANIKDPVEFEKQWAKIFGKK